jgi:hypothetical protein
MNAPSISGRSLARFGISTVVMASLTLGVAWAVAPPRQAPAASPGPGQLVDAQAGFRTVPDASQPPTPLGPPPENQVIQLVSFNKDAPPPAFGERAPWLNPAGFPRVPHITQFDGGKFGSVNCVMASGAMLARLAFGIQTSGTQLRSLQSNQRFGGTTLGNLEEAVQNGWGVGFQRGAISATLFRALMYAGAGAVIIVNYGEVPTGLKEQQSFFGSHAMYVDGIDFSGSEPHYYVMDPIGRPWRGYNGAWWPAEALEHAAKAFSGGPIVASWAFPGGQVPKGYPPLPVDDFPPSEHQGPNKPTPLPPLPSSVPTAVPSGAPSVVPSTGPSGGPSTGPSDGGEIGFPGPAVPPDVDDYLGTRPVEGVGGIKFFLGLCVTPTPPSFCPAGVPAVYPLPKVAPPTVPPLVNSIPLDLLYADTPQPGLQRAIFSAPQDSHPSFSFWRSDGSGQAQEADVVAATLDGKFVWIATFQVQPGSYDFVASSKVNGALSLSKIGQTTIGQ